MFWWLMKEIIFWLWAGWVDTYLQRSLSAQGPDATPDLWKQPFSAVRASGGYPGNATHIPFVPCRSGIPFLSYDFFKIWPWKSRVKVTGEVTVQSHKVGLTSYRLTSLSFHVNLASHYWVKDFFKIWPWNSRVKVMGEVTVQSHNVALTSYRLTSLSFHVNRPSHSWHTAFSKFDLENQWSRSWVR